MTTILGWLCVAIFLPATLLVVYQWIFAVVSLCSPTPGVPAGPRKRATFLILIPAHNEESSLPRTLENLQRLQYPKELVEIVVVADRCNDGTVAIAQRSGARCLERTTGPSGKGAAIAWSIEELRKGGTDFEALLILDADTIADPGALEAFNESLLSGHRIQQGYCYISNPWDTPFTRIIAVTSLLRNKFFYRGKAVARLSGMLIGTGMCFSHDIVRHYGWTAFSVAEDIEFSVSLLLAGEAIHFNPRARVFQLESSSLRQASGQRLRWAGGRSSIAVRSVWALFRMGLRRRSPYLLDAGLTLAAPNYSSQATAALVGLCAARLVSASEAWQFLWTWAGLLVGSLSAYFLLGVAFTDAPLKTLTGMALIPLFLPWRMAIELLGLLGYGRGRWIHTPRASASNPTANDH